MLRVTIYFLEFAEVKHNNLIISPKVYQELIAETLLLQYRTGHCNSMLSLKALKNGSFSTPDKEAIVTILETTHKSKRSYF